MIVSRKAAKAQRESNVDHEGHKDPSAAYSRNQMEKA